AVEAGPFHVDALPTPGHSPDGVAFVVNGEAVFTGDTLFRDAVGGGDCGQVRHSVMEVLMKLPPETRAVPRHREPSRAASTARPRRWWSGRPTTTARARRSCASRTAARRSSAARV